DCAGIEPITLFCDRIDGVTDEAESFTASEQKDPNSRRDRHKEQVGLRNCRPSAQVRRGETSSPVNTVVTYIGERPRSGMPSAEQIGEAKIYELHLLGSHIFKDCSGIHQDSS